jgi:NDP-sugar pyrophosphorylase family protein
MKCLIYGAHEYSSWVKRLFPGVSPFFLKICNKPLLEYCIDFCVSLGITDIRLVISDASQDVESYFGDGTQWGVNLSINVSRPDEEIGRVLVKNRGFCQDAELLVINGFSFVTYGQDAAADALLKCDNGMVISSTGTSALYHFAADASWDATAVEVAQSTLGLVELADVGVYYQLSMDLLQHPANYVLPGYAGETGAFMGKNVVYPKQAALEKPFLIGDNVQLKNGVTVGPQAVIGDNNIIDAYSTVQKSILYENSYISTDLEIIEKIIYRNRLIDPHSGASLDVTDNLFISGITHNVTFYMIKNVFRFLVALCMVIIGMPFYLLALPFAVVGGYRWRQTPCFVDVSGKEESFGRWVPQKLNFIGRFLRRFNFDRYPLLFAVLGGKLHLVGNYLLPKTPQNLSVLQEFPQYHPGVFDFTSLMQADHTDWNFMNHELYFISHDSYGFELSLLMRSIGQRLSGR